MVAFAAVSLATVAAFSASLLRLLRRHTATPAAAAAPIRSSGFIRPRPSVGRQNEQLPILLPNHSIALTCQISCS